MKTYEKTRADLVNALLEAGFSENQINSKVVSRLVDYLVERPKRVNQVDLDKGWSLKDQP